jgi:SAM-dependent methyltransferase
VAGTAAGTAGETCGIDPAPEMVELARRKAAQAGVRVRFEVGVIEVLPYLPDHFDVVLSSLMLHHLPDELKRRGLAEIHRVLKPAGRLVAVDFGATPQEGIGHLFCVLRLRTGWDHAERLQAMPASTRSRSGPPVIGPWPSCGAESHPLARPDPGELHHRLVEGRQPAEGQEGRPEVVEAGPADVLPAVWGAALGVTRSPSDAPPPPSLAHDPRRHGPSLPAPYRPRPGLSSRGGLGQAVDGARPLA